MGQGHGLRPCWRLTLQCMTGLPRTEGWFRSCSIGGAPQPVAGGVGGAAAGGGGGFFDGTPAAASAFLLGHHCTEYSARCRERLWITFRRGSYGGDLLDNTWLHLAYSVATTLCVTKTCYEFFVQACGTAVQLLPPSPHISDGVFASGQCQCSVPLPRFL